MMVLDKVGRWLLTLRIDSEMWPSFLLSPSPYVLPLFVLSMRWSRVIRKPRELGEVVAIRVWSPNPATFYFVPVRSAPCVFFSPPSLLLPLLLLLFFFSFRLRICKVMRATDRNKLTLILVATNGCDL